MTSLDPRAEAPKAGVENVAGRNSDRTTELLGILNKTIGAQGLGTKSFGVNRGEGLIDQVLGVHTLEPDPTLPSWVDTQTIFFQAAPQRLESIEAKVQESYNTLQEEFTNNIAGLFDTLQERETGLNSLEEQLQAAAARNDSTEVTRLSNLLDAAMSNVFTNDEALDAIINAFFEDFVVSFTAIQQELFDLLDDEDDNYSNGSTDAGSEKYFLQLPKRSLSKSAIRELVDSTENLDDVFAGLYKNTSLVFESALASDLREFLLNEKNMTVEDLRANIDNQKDFLEYMSQEEFLEIAGAHYKETDATETIKKLYADHIELAPREAVIIDNANDLLAAVINEAKELHETKRGLGTWTEEKSLNFIQNQVDGNFYDGSLNLDPALVELIIADRNIGEEEMKDFTSSSDFLEKLSLGRLMNLAAEFYGTSNKEATKEALLKDHLKINTPKYYEDHRSVQDIIDGKNTDVSNMSARDRIFMSVEAQIQGVAENVDNLLKYGYDKVAKNELQDNIRENPLSAIAFLETKRSSGSLSNSEKNTLDNKINQLSGRFQRVLGAKQKDLDIAISAINKLDNLEDPEAIEKNLDKIEDILKQFADFSEMADIKSYVKSNPNATKESILNIIDHFDEQKKKLQNYSPNKFADVAEELKEYFPIDNFNNDIDIDLFYKNIDDETSIYEAHKLLYIMEDNEANKTNANYIMRKLPTPKADGTIPEDTSPIPPPMAPSMMSAVIAKIGDIIIDKGRELASNDDLIKADEFAQSTQNLRKINDKIVQLNEEGLGSELISGLKANFKSTLKAFFELSHDKKVNKDLKKQEFEDAKLLREKLDLLVGTDSSVNLNSNSDKDGKRAQNLSNIETGLGGNLLDNNNYINKVGLQDAAEYLEDIISDFSSEQFKYDKDIDKKNTQIEKELEKEEPNQEKIDKLTAERDALIAEKQINLNNKNKAESLLNGPGNNISQAISNIKNTLDAATPVGQNRSVYIRKLESDKSKEYADAITDYSDSITAFSDEETDLEAKFRDTIKGTDSNPGLDLDGNGVNDFLDIGKVINNIGDLSDNIKNVFGNDKAVAGGIENQSIRRLILIMFFLSLTEPSYWEQQRAESDVSRYAVF